MKYLHVIRFFSFCLVLAALGLTLILTGCMGSPGKTAREIHRDHINYVNTNWLMLQKDIDEFLMIDRPSRLSDSLSR